MSVPAHHLDHHLQRRVLPADHARAQSREAYDSIGVCVCHASAPAQVRVAITFCSHGIVASNAVTELVLHIICSLARSSDPRRGSMPPMGSYGIQKSLRFFLLVLVLCWIGAIINRAIHIFKPSLTIYWLDILCAIFVPLQGCEATSRSFGTCISLILRPLLCASAS